MNGSERQALHDDSRARPTPPVAQTTGDAADHSQPGGAADRARAASLPPSGYGAAATLRTSDPRAKSAALACFLSIVPGLGQIYVGYYQRGFVHALVVASLMTFLISAGLDELLPLGVVFLIFFWLYNIIDAGRRAAMVNHVLAGGEIAELPQDFTMPRMGGSIVGGVALIVFGAVLLSNTVWGLSLEWIEQWWPLLPIIFGVYLIVRAVRDRASAPDGPE